MADFEPFAGMAQEDTLTLLQVAIVRLIDNLSVVSPDIAGRIRCVLDTGSSISTITTVNGVTTVTTVATVTNLAQLGGIAANQAMTALQIGSEADLRRNIVIT